MAIIVPTSKLSCELGRSVHQVLSTDWHIVFNEQQYKLMGFPALPLKAKRNSAMIWGHWKIHFAILIKVLNIP